MDVEKMRQGGVALCLAAGLALVWLVLGSDAEVGGYAALGALVAACVGLWRIGTGLAGRN